MDGQTDGRTELLHQYLELFENFFQKSTTPACPPTAPTSPVPLPLHSSTPFPLQGPPLGQYPTKRQKLIRDLNPDFRIYVDLGVCRIGVNML